MHVGADDADDAEPLALFGIGVAAPGPDGGQAFAQLRLAGVGVAQQRPQIVALGREQTGVEPALGRQPGVQSPQKAWLTLLMKPISPAPSA